ncbi:MAG: hypothetical protein AAF611_21790 [Bacteroidota bacterium]
MTKTKFYTWAFRFTIWIVIIQVVLIIFGFNIEYFAQDVDSLFNFLEKANVLGLIALLLFIVAVVFLIIGYVKREPQNYQFWVALLLCIGYIINLILGQVMVTTYVLF